MKPPIHALLIEDSPTDAKLVLRALGARWEVASERVDTEAALEAALARGPWDVVVSDFALPGFSALIALSALQRGGVDLPFIIVSGTIGEDATADLMRSGAHDVVLKDRLARLVPAVERELRERVVRAERRRAEEALRRSEARYRRLTESGVIGVAIADLNGAVSEANDAYLAMLGFSREDAAAGRIRWSDFTPPEYREVVARATAELEATGVARPWETEAIRRDGTRLSMLMGVAMLDAPQCIAFAADLTPQKRAEAARRAAEAALASTEAQLRHAQKMEAVGRLAGGVAHDFNNVLSVILSYGELVLADLSPLDPMRADIEEIRKAASRAAALTRQLLAFSRQQVVEARVIDLGEVLDGMRQMLRRLVGEDVELSIVADMPGGRILADPSGVEQVVMNLVVNARDAMPRGGQLLIELSKVELDAAFVEAHLSATSGPKVKLTVRDTGAGMDRETLARIFEPFFTTKDKGKGTGLGLSTVFGIVQQAGGSVFVESAPGRGSTFEVYFPRVEAEVHRAGVSSVPDTLRGDETVLLVEDEEQVRAIAATVLERQGYEVLVAASSGEALRVHERRGATIDLLLTDVVMPGISGLELAKRLVAASPKLKVLCMSGYTDDSMDRHGVLASEVAFMQKPFTPALLARRVRETLDAKPR